MAFITVMERELTVGEGQVFSAFFDFRANRAYAFYIRMTLSNPNSVFSFLKAGVFARLNPVGNAYLDNFKVFDIREATFVYLVPFTTIYGGNGDASITLERIPFYPAGGGQDSQLIVSVFYDDELSRNTWLR